MMNEEFKESLKKVFQAISEHNKNNDPIWFSKLKNHLEMCDVELNMAIDYLYDYCFIDGGYEEVDKKWTYCYKIIKF